MDPTKLRTWIAGKIEEHAPNRERPGDAVDLLVAAEALRGTPGKSMAFGLQLPADGVLEPEPLVARCLELLRAWAPFVPPASGGEFARAIARLEAPMGSSPAPRRGAHVLRVWCPAVLEDFESNEELVYDAPEVLREYDGVALRNRVELTELPCLRAAASGWAFGGAASLAFDGQEGTLSACLSFDLDRKPTQAELDRLLAAIRDELFFTSWGLNLEWDCDPKPDTAAVRVRRQIARSRIDARDDG